MSILVVESGEVFRAGGSIAIAAVFTRQPGSGQDGAPQKPGRPFQSISVPQHRKLFMGVPQGSQPHGRNWTDSTGINA